MRYTVPYKLECSSQVRSYHCGGASGRGWSRLSGMQKPGRRFYWYSTTQPLVLNIRQYQRPSTSGYCEMANKSMEPTATLSLLHRADGSASFSQNGYTVIGSVNGPIEVQRRDELPEEAFVDVVIRPAAGVGGLCAPGLDLERRSLIICCRHTRTAYGDNPESSTSPAHPHPQLP